MARRRRNRRYRRGRFLPLLRILLFLLICGALAAAMTVFFKVEEVSVSGNSRYTAQEVVEASGVALGDNLYLLNKDEIVARLTRELPYLSQVRIRRQLPSTLTVEVTETQAAAAVESGGTVWLISGQGKLLEQGGEAGGLPRITHSQADYDIMVKLHDSPANTLCLCTGSLGSNPDNDIPAIIRHFGEMDRIGAMHVRNVKYLGYRKFRESAHLSSCGDLDMYAIMKAIYDTCPDTYIRPDHGRMIWDEEGRPGYGLYDRALGATYLNGLWEAICRENGHPEMAN